MNKDHYNFCYNVSNLTLVTDSTDPHEGPIYHGAVWRIEPRLEQICEELITVLKQYGEVGFVGVCCNQRTGEMNAVFRVTFPDKRSTQLFKVKNPDEWNIVSNGVYIHRRFFARPENPDHQYCYKDEFDVGTFF